MDEIVKPESFSLIDFEFKLLTGTYFLLYFRKKN